MTNTKLIYAAAVATGILLAVLGVKTFIGEMQIRRIEADIAKQKAAAETLTETAAAKETEARRYIEKIAYLETKLTEINDVARRQNEEIEKAETVVRDARDNVRRVGGLRSIAVTADELCRKLAETGHPCR
jgi:chromosome segregation ATPase